jgi:hypothetical protein
MSSGSGPLFLGPDVASWQAIALVSQPTTPGQNPDAPGGEKEDFGKSSPVGLLVLLLFFIAVAFLVRSMTKHLKRVPESFDKPADTPASSDDASSDDAEDPKADEPAESDSVEEKK